MAYVILAGYQAYPDRIDSDVDFLVSESDFARLPELLSQPANVAGARLVQMLQHETTACYYVLAIQVGVHMAYLHPDAAAAYRRHGRLWLSSKAVLATRRLAPAGFWIPAVAVEFEYYFVKRVDKALLEARHIESLAALMAQDPDGCQAALQRLMPSRLLADVASAISKQNLAWLTAHRGALKTALQRCHAKEPFKHRCSNLWTELTRKVHRILQPTGLVIAVLGPDGSGKTTLINHLEQEFAPAFRQLRRFHLRPHFGNVASGGAVTQPHAQPPRGYFVSTLKMGLFLADYGSGWLRHVRLAKMRSSLVVFDRYFHDMLVDPQRYRLPQNFAPARWLAPLIPKPDLWLVLNAKPEQLVARKGEITLADAQQLSLAYQELARELPNAVMVDTSQSLEATLTDAVAAVRQQLEHRMSHRLAASR